MEIKVPTCNYFGEYNAQIQKKQTSALIRPQFY